MTQDEFTRLAAVWLKRGTWTPKQAARLLSEQLPYRQCGDDEPETGLAFHILDLIESFPDYRAERSPSDWIAWATARDLHINEALLLQSAENIHGYEAAPDPATRQATIKVGEGGAKVTKAEILATEWPLPNGARTLDSILDKIPKWVESACTRVGRPGKGAGGSHLWSPAQLAVCLAITTSHKKWKSNVQALTKHIRNNYSESLEAWNSLKENI